MRKTALVLVSFLFLTYTYAQYNQEFSGMQLSKGVEVYNGIRSVEDVERGTTFISKDGKQYSNYFKDLYMECGLIFYKVRQLNRVDVNGESRSKLEILPFMEVVKEVNHIDATYIDTYLTDDSGQKEYAIDQTAFIEKFVYHTPLFGWARKGEDYAFITKFGELITDFRYKKYKNDEYGLYVVDTLSNKEIYVTVDALGNEVYRGELPIPYHDGKDMYVFWGKEGRYLYSDGFKYPLTETLRSASNNGWGIKCNTLSDGRIIYRLNKGVIKEREPKQYRVISNFYKNRAIGRTTLHNREYLYIINEKGKAVKAIPEGFTDTGGVGFFDSYGLIRIYSEDNIVAVIDYEGNFVIPPCQYCDIEHLSDGLMGVFEYSEKDYRSRDNCIAELSGFYNQCGEKVLPVENSYYDPQLRLVEGVRYNFLMERTNVHYVLDKENKPLKQ